MPYTLAGFATDTRAAISGYAEGYHVGAASIARNVLFEAFWNHSVDLADANVVRTLLVDAIRTASPLTEDLHEWDYTGTLNGDQSASTRGLLIRRWAAEWQALEDPTVPLLVLADTDRLSGKSGIEWLGRELLKNGRLDHARTCDGSSWTRGSNQGSHHSGASATPPYPRKADPEKFGSHLPSRNPIGRRLLSLAIQLVASGTGAVALAGLERTDHQPHQRPGAAANSLRTTGAAAAAGDPGDRACAGRPGGRRHHRPGRRRRERGPDPRVCLRRGNGYRAVARRAVASSGDR